MLTFLMRDVQPHDRVRISLMNEALHHEVYVPFMSPDDLTVERIFQEVERILQSSSEWLEKDNIRVTFVHARIPAGEGKVNYGKLSDYLAKKQCFIQISSQNDCCAKAIVTAKAVIDNHSKKKAIRQGRAIQELLALQLMRDANVTPGTVCGREEFQKFQHVLSDYDIIVISRDFMNCIIYRGNDESDKQIILYHAENHFSVITKMTAFLNKSYVCQKCLVGFNNPGSHVCPVSCICKSSKLCTEGEQKHCNECNRIFKSELCLSKHYSNGTCRYVKACRECGKIYHAYRKHKCGYVHCRICCKEVPNSHKCYIRKLKTNEVQHQKFIFYDFECMLMNSIHTPNLCVVQKVCGKCMELPIGDLCECDRERKIFRGTNTLKEFGDWLFTPENKNSICIAHNAQGYDLHLMIDYIHTMGKKPVMIQNGQKILSLECAGVKFIDSLNFLPMALSKLPKAFGLKELKKGFFPHLFNIPANQMYRGAMPDKSFYDPDGMNEGMKAEFDEWYDSQTVFDFQKDLVSYCVSDVDILQRCCGRFRHLFMQHASNIDPFQDSITIASACNRVYRHLFLKEEEIAVIPAHGYSSGNQSVIAGCWLSYLCKSEGVHIQHKFNGGEVRVEGRLVDGLGENVVYQFHGCFWHGCPICYPQRTTVNCVNGCRMSELYERTRVFTARLKEKGYRVIEKWECEFRNDIKNDVELNDFYQLYKPYEPLKPREAFYGGRTNATKLFHECKNGEQIKYVDFTSLYPYVCKYAHFPIGHPTVYVGDQIPDKVEGLLKCKILPPQNLLHPVLPYRTRNKLMFPLCAKCADENVSDCIHSSEERALKGTWVTIEIEKALSLGYKILEKYEAWHFENTKQYNEITKSGGIWDSYINLWLKTKQEASGWPSWCQSISDKEKYIELYEKKEGVQLDQNSIERNEGLRSLSKLMLNSFWGKFGQNAKKDKVTYVDDPKEYVQMLTSDKIEVCDIRYVNEEMVMLRWREKDDFVESLPNTNVILAAYTTAHARLKLYQLLEKLQDRVLYFDTDSVVYVHVPSQWNPPLGDYLGELKDETNGVPIRCFVSGGAKNYAYELINGQCVCKIRGFTLNVRNSIKLNMHVMSQLIVNKDFTTTVPIHNPNAIKRVNGILMSKSEEKRYKLVYDKRVVKNNLTTVPFGYVD